MSCPRCELARDLERHARLIALGLEAAREAERYAYAYAHALTPEERRALREDEELLSTPLGSPWKKSRRAGRARGGVITRSQALEMLERVEGAERLPKPALPRGFRRICGRERPYGGWRRPVRHVARGVPWSWKVLPPSFPPARPAPQRALRQTWRHQRRGPLLRWRASSFRALYESSHSPRLRLRAGVPRSGRTLREALRAP